MVERITSCLIALAFTACVDAGQRNNIQIQNDLAKCIEIESTNAHVNGRTPFVTLNYKRVALTSECGCKSKLCAYSVYAESEGYKSFLIGGKVSFQEAGKMELPLSTDGKILGNRPVLLFLSCAQPD